MHDVPPVVAGDGSGDEDGEAVRAGGDGGHGGRVHAGVDGDELTAGDAAGGEEAVAGVRDARMTHLHRGRGTVVVAVAVATKKTRTRVPRRGSAELGGEGDGDHAVHLRARGFWGESKERGRELVARGGETERFAGRAGEQARPRRHGGCSRKGT